MKKQTHTNLFIRSGFALALAVGIWIPTAANAADEPMKPMKGGEHQMMVNPNPNANAEPADGKKRMREDKMKECCQEMKAKKEQIMAEMKAQDAELTAQCARMNNAPENEKPALMAALITQLVEQRVARDARRAKMEELMMKHMMQHMQMGKESMAQCPMMKGMGDMDAKSDSADKEHHEMEKK